MTATYTPEPGSHDAKAVEFFRANPDKHLLRVELGLLCGLPYDEVARAMEHAVEAGLIGVEKRGRGFRYVKGIELTMQRKGNAFDVRADIPSRGPNSVFALGGQQMAPVDEQGGDEPATAPPPAPRPAPASPWALLTPREQPAAAILQQLDLLEAAAAGAIDAAAHLFERLACVMGPAAPPAPESDEPTPASPLAQRIAACRQVVGQLQMHFQSALGRLEV